MPAEDIATATITQRDKKGTLYTSNISRDYSRPSGAAGKDTDNWSRNYMDAWETDIFACTCMIHCS